MRIAGLSTLIAHLSLHALSADAAHCYSNHHITDWSVSDASKLQVALNGPVTNFCNATTGIHGDGVVTYEIENISFHVIRRTIHSFEECKDSFADIIIQCSSNLRFDGGEVRGANGTIYKVDLWESAQNKLAVRRARGGRTKETRPKKTGIKKTRAKKTRPSKTATKKANSRKSSSKAKGKSSTTSSVKTKPTKSCKQIHALAAKAAKEEALDERNTKALAKRNDMSEMTILEKRTKKAGGSKCVFTKMDAFDYPNSRQMVCD